ncbi:uncharacterized protein LOC109841811 [Asparagus officinalis]|uniref:uncharacterized protein LOC109841811 n=1 Tax=Asparagus officinalis TaxID=4686 RepID=UPI00098E37E5|nr:uncharacterized protein LOC109841811 [Asparagus officinalis]
MVEKLGMKSEKYLTPYKIGWILKSNDVQVEKVCRVSFSICRNYVDEAFCDVIEMDACHMLLGRPGSLMLMPRIGGRTIVYIFKMDGRRVVLIPLTEKGPIKIDVAEKKTFLVIDNEDFLKDLKLSNEIYALVISGNKDFSSTKIPPEVQTFLQQFDTVMPDELPSELLMLRDVQHQIDFIPGSHLPNLPHYRMSPRKGEILQKKVDELI